MARNQTESLIQRLKKLSKAELESRDIFGRAVIHLVCLLGRFDMLEALLSNPQCQAKIQDYESRWTAFHYAVFYGKLSCARLLLEHDSDLVRLKDRSGLTAMDIYHLQYSLCNLKIWPQSIGNHDTNYTQRSQDIKIDDPLIWWNKDTRGGSDIYTFGVNVNYQLGTGDADDKLKAPYKVEIDNLRLKDRSLSIADRLVKPRVKDFVISKNHSVLITNEISNNLLVAGNPSRGRLGSGSLTPNYKFKHVEYFSDEHVVAAAVSDDHTLVLTADGHVYSWGLNNYYQLGYQTETIKDKPDTFSDMPKRVVNGLKRTKIKGVSCSKIHSCAYSGTSLTLWGLNVGQMDIISTGEAVGHGKFKGIVQNPRKVDFPHAIKQVIATEEATIVLLDTDECHILTNGNHLRFQIPLYKTLNNEFKFFRPTRFSKRKSIIKLVSKESTKIGILYDDGSVSNFCVDMLSKSSNIKYSTIWSPRNSHLKCIDVDIGRDGSIIIVTKSGCVYKRVARMNKSDFKFTKVERISKVVKVSCDSLFTSFGFIKDDVDQLPLDLFKNRFLVDLNSLSPLYSYTYGRKRAELVDTEAYESYNINYLHKPNIEMAEDDSQIFQRQFDVTKEDEDRSEDPLFNTYKHRWEFPQELNNTFQQPEDHDILELLMRESLHHFDSISDPNKNFDTFIECGGYRFGAHKNVLFLVDALRRIETRDVFIDDIKFAKLNDGVVDVKNMSPVSLLILLNVLYSGRILRPWESTFEVKQSMRHVQHETLFVLKALGLADELNRCTFNLHEMFGDRDRFENDVTVKLRDGESASCWSVLLKARNAYFETLFSERWEGDKILEFEHVRKDVFDVVLEYIYGREQMTLLDHLIVSSAADFINFCFEIIELSDELLLFGLKDFAQLMIKDFIASENVLLILHHADSLDCQKLIGECLWFIYNNVDSLLVDANYELLSVAVIERIDKYCRWVGKVNKVISPTDTQHWYEDNSDELLYKFLSCKRDFNDIFLSSDDFVPLLDTAPKKENKSPKLEPKKPKQQAPMVQLLSERRESGLAGTLQQPSFADQQRKSSLQDSSAIEFTTDDFQPVMSRRRKSSSGRRGSSSTIAPSSMTKLKGSNTSTPSKAIPMPQIYRHRNSSSGAIEQSTTSWFGHPNNSSSALSPMSNWASPGESSVLSSPASGTSWLKMDNNAGSPSSSKITFGTPRLSQKERKKLMKSEAENIPSKSDMPWKIPLRNVSNGNSPSIASAQEEAVASEAVIPSLKGIMHEEEHMVIESRRSNTKSLAEIQQEEEFAQWWEEESRRVQQEMAGFAVNKATQSNAERSKHKPKKRYNRQYRKQCVP